MGVGEVGARIEEIRTRLDSLRGAFVPSSPVVRTPAGNEFARTLAAAQATAPAPAAPAVRSGTVTAAAFAMVDRPSAARPAAGQGGALSDAQLRDVLAQAGFSGESLRVAWALARRESGGRPDAVSKPNGNGTIDHGLFQINDVHRGSWIDFSRLDDAAYSAKVAFRMSNGGTDFSAWGLGDTGWAGHLQKTAPATYAQLYDRFKDQYDKFPF